MSYLLVNVVINEVTDSGELVSIPSLLFTNTLDVEKAKKLSAFHIYHLHKNNQYVMPTIDSVHVDGNTVTVDDKTMIFFSAIRVIDEEQKQRIGKLGLFGYNKTLKKICKPLLACR